MFINENINVSDSAIFMGFMRQALIESLQENNADEDSIKYIEESASDAQVLSLAMYGKACPDDNPVFAESFLLSNLKDYMLENINDFDFSGKYTSVEFMNEIGGLSLVDTDSVSVINEGLMNDAINSVKKDYKKKSNTPIGGGPGKPKASLKSQSLIPDLDKNVANYKAGKNPFKAINDTVRRSPKVTDAMKSDAKAQIKRSEEVSKLSKDVPDTVKKASDNTVNQGNNSSTTNPDSSVDVNLMDRIRKAGDNISSAWGKFTKFVGEHQGAAKAIGVTALVGASAYLAYKAYKNYFSKAAKACKGKSGAEKDACMAKARIQGTKARINAFKKSMSACKATDNPSKCRQKYQSKIASLQAKLS